MFHLIYDNKNANMSLYKKYEAIGVAKVRGISGEEEAVLFDVDDVQFAHKHEGDSPGGLLFLNVIIVINEYVIYNITIGAGDILFSCMTEWFDKNFGETSHGKNLYGKGKWHNKTREVVMSGKMNATPKVLECATECIDTLSLYAPNDVVTWTRFTVIDMFFATMTGTLTRLTDPKKTKENTPLKELPENDEEAFTLGLKLSVLPNWMRSKHDIELFHHHMKNMTSMGVKEVETFLALNEKERPDSFFKSILEKGASEKDARELMAFFITVFSANTSLTLQNFMFHAANNPKQQEILYQEIIASQQNEGHLDIMERKIPYLEAFLKESHRITPIIDFTQVRQYEHELVLPRLVTNMW